MSEHRKMYRGRVTVTPAGEPPVERSIEIRELPDGRQRVRINGYGEGEVSIDDGGSFNNEPWATSEGELFRIRGVVEGHGGDRIQGGFTVSRDGNETATGRFDARKRRG